MLEKLKDDNTELFQRITNVELFCDTTQFPCNYTEDEWTERLSTSLQLNNINSELRKIIISQINVFTGLY